jgi:hypothetical protein
MVLEFCCRLIRHKKFSSRSVKISLLDGGCIFGGICEVKRTDEISCYYVSYCATAEDYCDFGNVLMSPNFTVDAQSTLILVELFDMLANCCGTVDWGLEVTKTSSLTVNAVGLYLVCLPMSRYFFYCKTALV